MRVLTGLLLSLAMAANAHAQANCANAPDQAAMSACADRAYKKSDAELNRAYQAVTTRVRDNRPLSDKLVSAQRAWLAYRDAECGFSSAGAEGGSVYPMVVSMCLDDLTKARLESLQGYLSCEEGDLACPVPAK
ncbi:lysozyme inhibitor LprI family protein [Burkholderia sp. JSH-S8]|uniref:lysozyme inhibitor LprI family protein n=1 Tax=Burkholderia stagnalis TaxID=1503054 RepID=UPI000F803BD0|nr:lysozyme inhibitor LprI family protein [Burkholderia stagnalis]WGS46329.1 lysozyme inhibitor LprI family protein [Burkholderia sp. JSH-S8]